MTTIYSLEVLQVDFDKIAISDLTFAIQFKADKIDRFELPEDQLRGYTHPGLIITLIVDSPSEYRRSLVSQNVESLERI